VTTRLQPADPCTVVIFGASGDLTRRLLLPSLYNLAEEGLIPDRFAVLGVGRSGTAEELAGKWREFVATQEADGLDDQAFNRVMGKFSYVQADFEDDAAWDRLAEAIAQSGDSIGTKNCLFYLAIAPEQFLNVCARLAARGLLAEEEGVSWRRVIVEKPFGTDYKSARELNRGLTAVMREHQIYRIDHYLGKETVQNIMVFRFGNGIFEPVWNRRYVDHVQITVAESLGVELRGGYYDQTGALRDMVPNHLFQILSLTAMEPPSSLEATALHNEQVKVLEAIEPLDTKEEVHNTVRAQYETGVVNGAAVTAYRAETKVSPSSLTETYAAFKLSVDNWRWAGVPFYLRTGKRLKRKKSEVVIQFRQPPLALFREASMAPPEPNQLVISIQPEETIKMKFSAKVPGPEVATAPVDMSFNYSEHFAVEQQTGYETLLYDAMVGDRSLYKRADMIESGWAVVDAILSGWAEDGSDLQRYIAGGQGPSASEKLLARDGRKWRPL
jgi:glucose-6-phosphate 1-dehydrogenase